MGSVDGDLEEQLLEAGKALLIQSMDEINQLLNHIDQVGKLLGKVEQSPSKSMLTALSPTIQAVVKNELLRNENEDVRVAVASCISEITRITAPDAPYEDNQMKEVFQLIVSSFKNLSDNSSQSYSKRTSILETVAKVRSCVVMLDLECDGLIVEMFQHFLKEIRDHHPDNVFSSMEIIMTLVLEESEDIGFELISPLLACLKKDNQEVLPIARKLAENVVQKSTRKIKPCMLVAKMSMDFSYDDYSTIIAEVCEETDHVRHGNHKSPGEQLTKDGVADGASSGGALQGDENKLNVPTSDQASQVAKVETKSGRVSKKRSKPPKHPMKPSVPSESLYTDTDTEKETKQIIEGELIMDKEAHASLSRDPSTEVAVDKENESETEQLSSPKYICKMWEILIRKLSKCRLEDLGSFEKVADRLLKKMEETTTINLSFLRTTVQDFFLKVHECDQQRLISLDMGFMEFPEQMLKEKIEQLDVTVANESRCKTKVVGFTRRLVIIETQMKRLNAEKDEVQALLAKEEDMISQAQSAIASLSVDLSKLEDQCLESYKAESNLEKFSKSLQIRLEELMNLKPFP